MHCRSEVQISDQSTTPLDRFSSRMRHINRWRNTLSWFHSGYVQRASSLWSHALFHQRWDWAKGDEFRNFSSWHQLNLLANALFWNLTRSQELTKENPVFTHGRWVFSEQGVAELPGLLQHEESVNQQRQQQAQAKNETVNLIKWKNQFMLCHLFSVLIVCPCVCLYCHRPIYAIRICM